MTASLVALVHKIAGSLLVLVGMVLFPMPIPVGLIMIVLGLALLAPYFPPVQRLICSLRRRYPSVDRTMLRFKSRCPRVIQVTIEKTNPHLQDDGSEKAGA